LRAIFSAAFNVTDYSKPSHNLGAVEPASRVYSHVSSERLDLANMSFAEANSLGGEE
jgi:hypothetical protein